MIKITQKGIIYLMILIAVVAIIVGAYVYIQKKPMSKTYSATVEDTNSSTLPTQATSSVKVVPPAPIKSSPPVKVKAVYIFKLSCWGNPPYNYLEIEKAEQQKIEELKLTYDVKVVGCDDPRRN